jgi:hypothetical protein
MQVPFKFQRLAINKIKYSYFYKFTVAVRPF